MSKKLSTTKKSAKHFENILASYDPESRIKLSKHEQELKNRWKSAYNMLTQWTDKTRVAAMLEDQHEISTASAYRDMANAIRLYGSFAKADKEGYRHIMIIKREQLMEIALDRDELDIVERCLTKLENLYGLHDDELQFNLEKIENLNLEVTIHDKSVKQLDALIKKGGVLDFNDIQDIEYEEVEEPKADTNE